MSDQNEDSEKSFEATPQKLIEARKKGDIAKSTEIFAAATYLGLLVALLLGGEQRLKSMCSALMVLLDQPDKLSSLFLVGGANPMVAQLAFDVIFSLSAIFVLPAVGVILAIIAQRALVFAPSKLMPKLSRLSPIANAKNKFGRSGLFEFSKSFLKLCIYSFCITIFIRARLPEMFVILQTTPHLMTALLAELCLVFLLIAVVISSIIGSIDAIWQHVEHRRKNRMTRKEITDETKNSEGDPHLKQERRQRAMTIAQNQMMADVPTADVIVVNPTHYAVVLKWDRKPGVAPICVAKGVDEIAHVIRKIGIEAGVPIHSDPPTARLLFSTTKIGDEIDYSQYNAVAAAIRFAQSMRQRARRFQ